MSIDFTDKPFDPTDDSNMPVCTGIHDVDVYFDWKWKGCGFGQFSIIYDAETKKFSASREGMGPVSSRKLLHALADYIADNLDYADGS